jgi:hypothetical protein
MLQIKFRDGQRVPWPIHRAIMLGELSPQAAVAQMRREPAGAYDQAFRRGARDQIRDRPQNGGGLSQVYCDATRKFLADNALDPADIDAVMSVLSKYTEEPPAGDEENPEMPEGKRVRVGGPRGPVGASDRRHMALDQFDQFGQPRSNPATPMPLGGDDRGFSRRFPDAARIRTA